MARKAEIPREVIAYYDEENKHIKERKTLLGKKLDGEYASYYANGHVMVRMRFQNGMRQGEAEAYYRDGQIRERASFRDDRFVGDYTSWYENGRSGTGNLSRWPADGPTGLLSDRTAKEKNSIAYGKLNGPYRSWYTDSQLKESASSRIDRRKANTMALDRNGQIRTGRFTGTASWSEDSSPSTKKG
jgi:antitoxin component YwqK of YwqJK toxin-antitoxin module